MFGVGGVIFIARDKNLRISPWGRVGVDVGVAVEEWRSGGGELGVEGAIQDLFLVNVHYDCTCIIYVSVTAVSPSVWC